MIYDRVENAKTYLGIHPNLDRALREIQKGTYKTWENGRNTVDGDSVFCNVVMMKYGQKPLWERHEGYLDIHINFEGTEGIRVADKNQVPDWEAFHPESDSAVAPFSEDGLVMPMKKDTFLIVFPQDAHMPGVGPDGGSGRKAIFKVRITD